MDKISLKQICEFDGCKTSGGDMMDWTTETDVGCKTQFVSEWDIQKIF